MPEVGQSAGGQPPQRSSAHLQPEVRPADLFTFVGEMLEQFDVDADTTVEETREADHATTRLARLGDDTELYHRLAKQNFTGIEYELFRAELAAYALPVLRSFIRRKMIYPMCQRARRPANATETVREHPARDVDDRLELAGETIARGLRLFERYALLGGSWSPERGASLKTFFVGACVRSFSVAFKRWATEHDHPDVRALILDAAGDYSTGHDPADEVVGMARVKDHLDGMKPVARDLAARVTLFGAVFPPERSKAISTGTAKKPSAAMRRSEVEHERRARPGRRHLRAAPSPSDRSPSRQGARTAG